MLADASPGIPLGISALEMTGIERRATIKVLKDIRERQKETK